MSNSAMREALKNLVDRTSEYIKECNPSIAGGCEIRRALENAKDVLSTPPRNCDVGTAEEQTKRYDVYCYDHRNMENGCGDCPLKQAAVCEIAFGQMPYEAERKGDRL